MKELRDLEPDFWRAPSAHNTQPWTLRYGDQEAEIGWDPAHALPISDPTGRDLRLSLGAFVECCLIVCASAGLRVAFRPDPGPSRIGFLYGTPQPYQTPFTTADVRARGSNRGPYLPGRLDDGVIKEVIRHAFTGEPPLLPGAGAGGDGRFARAGSAGSWAGGAGGAGVWRVACRELVGLLHDADRHQFGDPRVTGELREWLRLTPRHPRYRQDGLTDRALSLSRAEALGLRAVLSRPAYPLLRPIGLPKVLADSSRGLLDYDGEVLVLVGPVEDQVTMGRVLMRQWLALSGLGYAAHPLSQVIDCADTRAGLARLLGVADPARLLSVARVGRPLRPAVRSARIRT